MAATTRAWHAVDAAEAMTALGAGPDGLGAGEATARLALHGPNRLPAPPRRTALARLVAQIHNLLIYVLLASALVATVLGHGVDALVILAVVVVNALIGFIQEGRAEDALASIRTMIDPSASVIRDGRRTTLPADDIVPGDVVLLEAGDRVPADLRLIQARSLTLDEAALTGESVPAEKGIAPVAADAPLGDRASLAFSGTFVAGGSGAGVAVATGTATELGRISSLLGSVQPMRTPLIRQMDRFARQITLVTLAGSAAILLFAVMLRGYSVADAFMAVVGLAVAVIPESLPAVMTITLAIGVRRMAARHAIIRRLPAVETLGSVTTICSDKTGTLTRNEMTVQTVISADRRFTVHGVGYAPQGAIEPAGDPILGEIALAALLCNDAQLRRHGSDWAIEGDPMEGALVVLGAKAGHESEPVRAQFPRVDEVPFDARHRYMATLHRPVGGEALVHVKGAPERLLDMCRVQRSAAGDVALDPAFWHHAVESLAAGGQRVLAVATRSHAGRAGTPGHGRDRRRPGLSRAARADRSPAHGSDGGGPRLPCRRDRDQDDHRRPCGDGTRHCSPAGSRPGAEGRDRPRAGRPRPGRSAPGGARRYGLRPHQPRAQAAAGRSAAGRWGGGRHDRRRRQRRAGAEAGGCRRRHGPARHRGRQGGGGDGAGGRQLRLDRRRRARGPDRLRQSDEGRRLDPAHQRRHGAGGDRRHPGRADAPADPGADPVGQPADRQRARHDAGLRADRARHHAPPAAPARRAHPHRPARLARPLGLDPRQPPRCSPCSCWPCGAA